MKTGTGMLVVALLWSGGGMAAAQDSIQRWKDEKGVPNFSNIGPPSADGAATSGTVESLPSTTTSENRGEPSAEIPSAAAPAPSGPFGSLSAEGFSSTVTRERLTLKRQITVAKRELESATEALEREEKRKAVPTPSTQFDRIISGVTTAADGAPPDQEKALRERKEAAQKRVEEIRKRFGELEAEANRRYGRLPEWWLPLE